jgi:methylated-DNA-[protein]-cysteine S-methyltransferase
MKLDPSFLERLSAAAIDEGLADVVFDSVDTPIGELLVAQSASGLCRVAFEDEPKDEVLAKLARAIGPRVLVSHAETEATRDSLLAYFEGDPATFDIGIDFSLVSSEFQRKVLETLLAEVPRGETTSYGHLADATGHPRASRATGRWGGTRSRSWCRVIGSCPAAELSATTAVGRGARSSCCNSRA